MKHLEESDANLSDEPDQVLRRLANLVENSSDAIITRGLDMRIISWNKGAENFFGYSKAEAIGKTPKELSLYECTQEHEAGMEEKLKQTESFSGEKKYFHKNGIVKYGSATISSVKDGFDKLKYMMIVIKDITIQKTLETDLRNQNEILEEKIRERTSELFKTEQRFRTMIENNNDIIALLDAEGKIIYRSPSATRITGWSNEEINSLDFVKQIIHPDDAEQHLENFKEVFRNPGKIVNILQRLMHKNGYYIWQEGILINMLHDEHIKAVVFNSRDITEKKQAEIILKENEEKYRSLVENIMEGFIVVDTSWNFVYVNKTAAILLGKSEQFLIGKNIFKELAIPENSTFYKTFHHSMESQEPITVEKFSNALNIWIMVHLYPSPAGLTLFFRDITIKKKVLDNLIEREEQLELFIKHSPASIAMFDKEMKYMIVSKRWISDYSLNEIELKGLSHYEVFPEIPDYWKKIHQRCLKGDTLKNEEDRFVRTDGTIQWLQWEICPWHKATGEIGGIIIFTEDITNRKNVLNNLLQNQKRFKQAQEVAHAGNWEINFKEGITTWSDEAYRIFGMQPGKADLTFDDWIALIHPDDKEDILNQTNKAQETLSDLEFYYRIIRSDGEIRYIYSSSKFEFNEEGIPIGIYGICHDITEKTKLEHELFDRQLKEQLNLITAAQDAEEKQRNIIGIELHDNIGQLLVGARLLLSTVKNGPLEFQSKINTCMENLQQAIDENRKIAHELVTPDFEEDALMFQINSLILTMLKPASIEVKLETSQFKEYLLTNKQKLAIYRITQEQFTNIIKYASATSVTISLNVEGNTFEMSISDNGVGIQEDELNDGIGLKNIKGRLSIFHGNLNIISTPGNGFNMKISMPLNNAI